MTAGQLLTGVKFADTCLALTVLPHYTAEQPGSQKCIERRSSVPF